MCVPVKLLAQEHPLAPGRTVPPFIKEQGWGFGCPRERYWAVKDSLDAADAHNFPTIGEDACSVLARVGGPKAMLREVDESGQRMVWFYDAGSAFGRTIFGEHGLVTKMAGWEEQLIRLIVVEEVAERKWVVVRLRW